MPDGEAAVRRSQPLPPAAASAGFTGVYMGLTWVRAIPSSAVV